MNRALELAKRFEHSELHEDSRSRRPREHYRPDRFNHIVNALLRRRFWHFRRLEYRHQSTVTFPGYMETAAIGFDPEHHEWRFHDPQPEYEWGLCSTGKETLFRGEHVSGHFWLFPRFGSDIQNPALTVAEGKLEFPALG